MLTAALGLAASSAAAQDGVPRPGMAFTVAVHQSVTVPDQPPKVSDGVIRRTVVSNDATGLVIHNSFLTPPATGPMPVEVPENRTTYDRFLAVSTKLITHSPSGGAPVVTTTETACDRGVFDGFFPLGRVTALEVPCTFRAWRGSDAASEQSYVLNVIYEGRSDLALPIGTFTVHAIRTVQTQRGTSTLTRYQFSPELGLSIRSETETLRLEGPLFQSRNEIIAIERQP